jgi:hypothetical protein
VEVDWPEDPETVILMENAGNCEAACISLEDGCLRWVEMLEDRCCGEGLLDLLKGKFRISSQFPFCRRLSLSFESAVGPCFK